LGGFCRTGVCSLNEAKLDSATTLDLADCRDCVYVGYDHVSPYKVFEYNVFTMKLYPYNSNSKTMLWEWNLRYQDQFRKESFSVKNYLGFVKNESYPCHELNWHTDQWRDRQVIPKVVASDKLFLKGHNAGSFQAISSSNNSPCHHDGFQSA